MLSALTGCLLVATPQMGDARFVQSVIYLCAHTPEGAMGITVNRPLRQPSFSELLQQLDIEIADPAREIRLFAGGPVEDARGFVLHTADWSSTGTLRVDDRLALTASLDVLREIAEGGGPRAGILALGYAGWGPGQLDSEIQENAWLIVPADDLDLIFGEDDAGKWRGALRALRVDPALLSGSIGHA